MKCTNPEESLNRTGMATSGVLADEMQQIPELTFPSSGGDEREIAMMRIEYAGSGDGFGSIPLPVSSASLLEAGTGDAAVDSPAGEAAAGEAACDPTQILLDKLGERLAFERTGVRLYEAVLSKHDAYGTWPGGPSREELLELRNEEQEHFALVSEVLEELGADPTAVTPSANVQAIATCGILEVLTDPRTDLQQCLDVMLTAELTDSEAWEMLIDLAPLSGDDELAARFETAQEHEDRHLQLVRQWLLSWYEAARGGAQDSGDEQDAQGEPAAAAKGKTRRSSKSSKAATRG